MASKREKDKNGYIEIKGNPIAKAGVYPYLGSSIGADEPDRIYYIFRAPEEIASEKALETLKLMPIIDDHPEDFLGPKEKGLIPPESKGVHGVVGEDVYFDGDTIYGNIKIFSKTFMDNVDLRKKQELSAAMWGDFHMKHGEWNGQKYDGQLKNIEFNHVALVQEGRMGKEVRVLDKSDIDKSDIDKSDIDEIQPGIINPDLTTNKGFNMSKVDELRAAAKGFLAALDEFLGEEAAEPEHEGVEDESAENEAEYETGKEEAAEAEREVEGVKDEGEKDKVMSEKQDKVMDAAISKMVEKRIQSALADASNRDKLYAKVKPVIGVMDCSDMTHASLAAYAAKKIGLTVAKGQEAAVIEGYLAATKQAKVMDAADDSAATVLIDLERFK